MSYKIVSIMILSVLFLGFSSAALGAEPSDGVQASVNGDSFISDVGVGRFAGPIGAGLVIIGGALGIAKIAVSACESIARQPEAGGRIFTSMIISAAMIEGATLFGVVVCLLPVLK